jgi:hypothetical protein
MEQEALLQCVGKQADKRSQQTHHEQERQCEQKESKL